MHLFLDGVCVCTYTLNGVGTGGPAQHRNSTVLLVRVRLQSHLVSGHAEGGDHLADAAGKRVSAGHMVTSPLTLSMQHS